MEQSPLLTIREGKIILADSFQYRFPWKTDEYVVVPMGYRTNFASIPWIARWLISPIDRHIMIAAIVHDWLTLEFRVRPAGYYPMIFTDKNGLEQVSDVHVSWDQAATIMKKIMHFEGAGRLKRMSVYLAIRLWGVMNH